MNFLRCSVCPSFLRIFLSVVHVWTKLFTLATQHGTAEPGRPRRVSRASQLSGSAVSTPPCWDGGT